MYKYQQSYKTGMFNVGNGHQLYYELYGNPQGKPMVFFHGGPGAGFSERDKRFFDPKIWNVLFFDQRGAGKSIPFASINHNTTQDLVSDTKRIMRHVNFQHATFFGGSWGSTLALLVAIQNPKLVTQMILRGIFLANKSDIEFFIGGGVKNHFPDVWERFVANVPLKKRKDIASFYLSQMTSKNLDVAEKFAYEWCFYEASLTKLDLSIKKIEKMFKHDTTYKSLSPLEAHYVLNKCFISENYILNNANRITAIPSIIVQGRYDFVCPPVNAYMLNKALPESKLYIVTGGHSSSDRYIEKALKEAVKFFS